jgi:zona occludens toxin (predicted ATPase)
MPAIAIIGLPGGGKSYFATREILRFLKEDKRNIVTNIPLNLLEIQKRFPDDFTVIDRITLLPALDFEKSKSFYLHRGQGKILPSFPEDLNQFSDDGDEVDPAKVLEYFGPGVVYFLDEVHQFLNARNWRSVGPDILRYLSMHRHFGDDIFWITQAPGNVDRQWRSLTQSYFCCRNYKFEKFRGMSKGSGMEVRETINIPGPHNEEIAQSVTTLQLDPEISKCYQTSVLGGQADTGRKARGIHYRWLIAGVFVVLFAVLFGIMGLGKVVVGRFFKTAERPIFAEKKETIGETQKANIQPKNEKETNFPKSDFVVRDSAPSGFVTTTKSKIIHIKSDSVLAPKYGLLPPRFSDLKVQGFLVRGGRKSLCIDFRLYSDGDYLPDGTKLFSSDSMLAFDPLKSQYVRLNQPSLIPLSNTVGAVGPGEAGPPAAASVSSEISKAVSFSPIPDLNSKLK